MSDPAPRPEAVGPNTWGRQRRTDRQRRAVVSAIVLVLLVATFLLATGQTGFPGPGPLRRYPTSELQELADRFNHLGCEGSQVWPAPEASVDWIRSRVRLGHPEGVIPSAHDRAMIENPAPFPGPVPRESVTGCPTTQTLAG